MVTLEQIAASGVKWMKKKCLSEGYEHTNLQSGVLKCFLTNNIEKVKKHVIAQNKLFHQNEEFLNKENLNRYVCSDKYTCGVFRQDSFQFHPLNFMHALAKDCSNKGASIFENCKFIIKEDTYAAVYASATIGEKSIVCILGTGSNCTFFDGKSAEQLIISLGYILMDEASGNFFGKQLIRSYYFNEMPSDLANPAVNAEAIVQPVP